MGKQYRTCPWCGDRLDPGERCDCQSRITADKETARIIRTPPPRREVPAQNARATPQRPNAANIKAEVVLDTLLTPYISKLVNRQLKLDTAFVTKEMSIPKQDEDGKLKYGGARPKIDYVLADSQKIYLVELKTTASSLDTGQAERYLENCREKRFGETLGRQLLSILQKKKQKGFHLELGRPAAWDDGTLEIAFRAVFEKFGPDITGETHAEKARKLIRDRQWTQSKNCRSRKYLYTLGQLLDYRAAGGTLWDKPLEVIYLTPDGNSPKDCLCASLTDFSAYPAGGQNENNMDDNIYVRFLIEIIAEIYGVKLPE